MNWCEFTIANSWTLAHEHVEMGIDFVIKLLMWNSNLLVSIFTFWIAREKVYSDVCFSPGNEIINNKRTILPPIDMKS